MSKPTRPVVFRMTEDDYHMHNNSSDGGCLACGAITDGGCEPDARNYPCDACGAKQVFGIEELMICGKIEITEDEGETE